MRANTRPCGLGEIWRSRVLYKSLDAVLTSPLRQRARLAATIQTVLRPTSAHYERVGASAAFFERIAPSLATATRRRLVRTQALPIACDSVDLLGYGSGATVFVATCPARRVVLKVYRRSFGLALPRVLAITAELRAKHRQVVDWYAELPMLVPWTAYVVLHGPLLGRPAAACFQELVPAGARALLADGAADEIIALADRAPSLRADVLRFARITRSLFERGAAIDLLGHDNIVIVPASSREPGHEPRLRVLDFGALDLAEVARARADIVPRIQAAVARLDSLAQRLGS